MRDLNRRQAVAGAGAVSLSALLAACSEDEPSRESTGRAGFDDTSACTLTPEQTEGPYYFDVDKIRSDIREDREGVPLELAVRTTAAVYRRSPYAEDAGRDAFNRTDPIFDERLVLDLSSNGDGYRGAISFDVERT